MAINCSRKQSNCVRNLPDVPLNITGADSSSDVSDSIVNNNTKTKVTICVSDEFESDGDIYENLDDLAERRQIHSNRSSDNSDHSPMLPPRQQIFHHSTHQRTIDENVTYNNLSIRPHDNRVVTDLDDGPEKEEEEEEENTYDPVLNGEEYEEEDIYDELRIPEPSPVTAPVPVTVQTISMPVKPPTSNLPPKPIRISSLPPVQPIPVQNNDYEDEEECSYDIPRIEQQATSQKPPTPVNTVESDEDVEYDELKAPSPTVKKKIIVKVGQPSEPNVVPSKPAITSPKPKIQFKLEKLSSFSRQKEANADNGTQDSEPGKEKKIHNIIQQMEATLFRGSKN